MLHDKMLKPSDSEQKDPQMILDDFSVSIIIWTVLCFTMAGLLQLKQKPSYLLVNSWYVRLCESSWSLIFKNWCSAEIWTLVFTSWAQQSSEPAFWSPQKQKSVFTSVDLLKDNPHKISHGIWQTPSSESLLNW